MKNTIFIIFLFVFVNHYAQIEEHTKSKKELRVEKRAQKRKDKEERIKSYINPKGKWFFGAEIGSNRIINYDIKKDKISFQGGFLAEYYIARHWSLFTKIKYYETGLSFYQPEFVGGGMGFFSSYSHGEYSGTFKGEVFSTTLNVKWEFRIIKNFKGNIKYGFSYNKETISEYLNYSETVKTDFPSFYIKQFGGLGFNYFIDSTSAIYLDLDFHNGETKGYIYKHNPQKLGNTLVSIGYKYSFN